MAALCPLSPSQEDEEIDFGRLLIRFQQTRDMPCVPVCYCLSLQSHRLSSADREEMVASVIRADARLEEQCKSLVPEIVFSAVRTLDKLLSCTDVCVRSRTQLGWLTMGALLATYKMFRMEDMSDINITYMLQVFGFDDKEDTYRKRLMDNEGFIVGRLKGVQWKDTVMWHMESSSSDIEDSIHRWKTIYICEKACMFEHMLKWPQDDLVRAAINLAMTKTNESQLLLQKQLVECIENVSSDRYILVDDKYASDRRDKASILVKASVPFLKQSCGMDDGLDKIFLSSLQK